MGSKFPNLVSKLAIHRFLRAQPEAYAIELHNANCRLFDSN